MTSAKESKRRSSSDWEWLASIKEKDIRPQANSTLEGLINQYVMDSTSADGKTICHLGDIEKHSGGYRARETYKILVRRFKEVL